MGGVKSVVAVCKGSEEVAKHVAMQVCSMTPTYISRDYMPAEIVERETKVQTEIVNADPKFAGKPEKVIGERGIHIGLQGNLEIVEHPETASSPKAEGNEREIRIHVQLIDRLEFAQGKLCGDL